MTTHDVQNMILDLRSAAAVAGDHEIVEMCDLAKGRELYGDDNELLTAADLDIDSVRYVEAICESLDAGAEGWIDVEGTHCFAC